MKKIPAYFWTLVAIAALGLFLRAYNISDWLRFGPDQARDADIIGNIIENNGPLPLLGPQSGNTLFYTGPIYYWLGYASASTLGVSPPVFAYPIIFFSVLSIPLLYYFLKQFFSRNISLALASIYAISYFSVVNSRYASNVNLIPFFLILFLFAIIKISQPGDNSKISWYILWGISLGICIQLHTLLFVSLPLISLLVFFYLLKKRSFKLSGIILAALFFLAVNWSQILYDIKFQGANISGFFHGIETQSSGESNLMRNIKLVAACQLQANAQIIFPMETREDCEIFNIKKNYSGDPNTRGEIKGFYYIFELILVLAFSVGGYFLLLKYLFRKDVSMYQKTFLATAGIYNAIALLVFVPVAGEIGTRYFLVLIFIPFILLGLWIKTLMRLINNPVVKKLVVAGILIIVFFGNIYAISDTTKKFMDGQASSDKLSVLSEIRPIAEFIVENSKDNEISLSGERSVMDRFDKSLMYLAKEKGVLINKDKADSGRYFWIGTSDKKDGQDLMKKIGNQRIVKSFNSGNLWIFILEK